GGLRWIVGDLLSRVPLVWRDRQPVQWSTIRKWRRVRRDSPRWIPHGDGRDVQVSESASRTIGVGITTSNRPQRLTDCLRSLALLGDLVSAIIVVDDASDVPARDAIGPLPAAIADKLTIIRQPEPGGNILCRNVAMRHATTDEVLLLDDDTVIIRSETIRRGLELMHRDGAIAAVGFAMASPDGALLPSLMQPSPARYVCYVPSYIGFAHLIRRAPFFQVGGYRELFQRHGEEKECCLRLMDAGYDIVFLPDPPIVHHVDPTGRNLKRYLRTVIRNDCLGALYNEPLPMLVFTLPFRLFRYLKMRRKAGVSDPGGFVWIVHELARHFSEMHAGEACRVVPVPVHFGRRVHTMLYGHALARLLRQPWDVVHCWEEPYVASAAQIANATALRVPLVFATFQNIMKRYPPPFNWIERSAMRRADGLIAFGHTARDVLGARGWQQPARTIPPGVDVAQFRPDAEQRARTRARFGWTDDTPVVGFVGRFVPEKGVSMLLQTLDRVKTPWRALFVGSG